MQHSLSIISTPVGAIPANNPIALAEAMAKMIRNPQTAHEMGVKEYDRFMKNYTSRQFEHNFYQHGFLVC